MQRTVNSTPKITVTLVKNEKQNTFIIILEYAVYFVGWSNFDGILTSRNVHVLYKKSSINILFLKQDTFRDNNNNNNNNNNNKQHQTVQLNTDHLPGNESTLLTIFFNKH